MLHARMQNDCLARKTPYFGVRVVVRIYILLHLVTLVACGGLVEPEDRPAPSNPPSTNVPVPGLPIVELAGGADELCALRSDGALFCVDSSKAVAEATPSRIADLPSATSVSVARGYGCVIASQGDVWCWGAVLHATPSSRPSRVPLEKETRQIACADDHCCALAVDGEVLCWGSNAEGQLGNARAGVEATVPVEVELGGVRATALTSGHQFSCVLTTEANVRCWGSNATGNLGIGSRQRSSAVPVVVEGLRDVTALRSTSGTTCAIGVGQQVHCWGVEVSLQPGPDGLVGLAYEPRAITGFVPIQRVAVGPREVCGIDKAESVVCYGYSPSYGAAPGPALGGGASLITSLARGAKGIALSDFKVAAVDAVGVVWAWGDAVSPSKASATPARIAFPR